MSYKNLHEMAGRATPDQLLKYKLALQLYKTFNHQVPSQDWINININITSRQTHFIIQKCNRLRLGMNIISNRFSVLNGRIELKWFNLTYDSLKVV